MSIIQERKTSDFHWERMPVPGAELSDLDDTPRKPKGGQKEQAFFMFFPVKT